MAYIIDSSPGAGLRFEPSVTVADADAALNQASAMVRRGMRLIRIKDTESGQVFDENSLREHTRRLKAAAKAPEAG